MTILDCRIGQQTSLPLIRPLLFMQSIGFSPVVDCITQSALYCKKWVSRQYETLHKVCGNVSSVWRHSILLVVPITKRKRSKMGSTPLGAENTADGSGRKETPESSPPSSISLQVQMLKHYLY